MSARMTALVPSLALTLLVGVVETTFAADLPFTFESGLAIGQIGKSVRSPIRFDAIEHRIVVGTFETPTDGAEVTAPDGTVQTWSPIKAGPGDPPSFTGDALNGGYLLATFESDSDRTAMLDARGHSMVYVNGEPHAGDPYSYGWLRIPVALRMGRNEFLFACSRGHLEAKLVACPSNGPSFLGSDDTLPNLMAGEDNDLPLGVMVVQPASTPIDGLALEVRGPDGTVHTAKLPPMVGLSTAKVAGRITARPAAAGPVHVDLVLKRGDEVVAQRSIELTAVGPRDRRVITFVSDIDGSVQYYACVPASGEGRPGLILSLHGASVEATSQAASYQPKPWAHIVCPTNRRAYGFDWEDWGRLDAFEVLADATRRFDPDPRRRWLTGHSMGGHGTWQLGAHFPGRFAAIAPSAGWISFATYGGTPLSTEGVEGMFARATSASDTLALRSNLAEPGIYILHGDVDDNVPVDHARRMRAVLGGGEGGFHPDFVYFEKKGANHWWGSECVDWPPLMRFLEERTLPDPGSIDRVDFVTASPSVSNVCHWLAIDQQTKAWTPSSASVTLDRLKRTVEGSTSNVARLSIQPPIDGGPIKVTLDRTTVETTLEAGKPLWLVKSGESWKVGDPPRPGEKRADRGGAFKDAIRHDAVIVYGTAGDDANDAALLAKARFDAESFLYRGNGSLEIVADTAFDPAAYADRGVLLLGNAETNAAWNALLGSCPVLVRNGSVKVGDQELAGGDLACVFAYPRSDSDVACVAVVAGTGPVGTRLSMRLPYFVSGVGYPDLAVLQANTLLSGAAGFRAAGFFGNDWSVERGDWAKAPAP